MKPNRKNVKDLGKAFKLFEALANAVYDRGGDDGTLCRIDQKSVREKMVDVLMGAPGLVLKNLKLVTANIYLAMTEPFAKDSFFGKSGPVTLYFWDNFKNWVLREIPETIPALEVTLTKTELTKTMSDSEILSELGAPKPFTPAEFAAIVKRLLSTQPRGEDGGYLLMNGYANIFYVKLADERVVAVDLVWYAGRGDWRLHAFGLDDGGWVGGDCVFSCS